ncbi:MAG: DUF4115 domain-containing protein [Elusimicrobia bacterium]|nr:DUF4115 domain-containing protein [Elusimicrobiota bacterium]
MVTQEQPVAAGIAAPNTVIVPIHEAMRSRRLERGLAIEKVREDTKIPVKYLQALEEGRYNVFPAKVYCRGFFMTYVRYLGLGEPIEQWEHLEHALSPKDEHVSLLHRRDEDSAATPARRSNAALDGNLWTRFVLWSAEGQNWILAFLVFPAAVIIGIYGIYSYSQHQSYRMSPRDTLDIPKIIGQVNSPARPSITGGMPAAPIGFSAEISANTEPSWIHVEMDGKMAFQGILPAQQKRTFQVRQGVKIRIGNPKNTQLLVNGNPWNFSAEEMERMPLEVQLNQSAIASRYGARSAGNPSGQAYPVSSNP